jgi:hypothetical protein
MKQGSEFIKYASTSLLVKTLIDLGFFYETEISVEDKDYGDGAIAYFDMAYLYFTLENKPVEGFHTDDAFGTGRDIMIYHSRFSDHWYFHVHDERIESWGFELDDMNKPGVVNMLIGTVKNRMGLS